MKKLICLLAIPLAACGNPLGGFDSTPIPIASPAPLAKTSIDDEQLRNAWLAYEAAIDAINVARGFGAFKKGTPKAIALADANDKVLAAFLTAEQVAAGLSTTDPLVALARLKAALAEFRVVVGSK